MHSISKFKKYIVVVLTNILIFCSLQGHSQNSSIRIQVTVLPPYSSVLSDYISNSNKILVSLLNTSSQEKEVYLTFKLLSDGGITIESEPGYKPNQSIILPSGLMQTFSISQLSDMFNINRLVTNGIILNELITGSGLPEDYYQICFRAFDYVTDQTLSDEDPSGCSNLFQITNLEPPVINDNFCGENIEITPFQSIIIGWSIPSGSFGTEYLVEIKEVSPMFDIDVNEAFMIPEIQTIYQQSQMHNSLVLTSDRTALVPGYQYAIRIQATDPNGNYHFRNNGYSEICSFTWGSDNSEISGNNMIKIISPEKCGKKNNITVSNKKDFYMRWLLTSDPTTSTYDAFEKLEDSYPNSTFIINFYESKNGSTSIYTSETTDFYLQKSLNNVQHIFNHNQNYWFTIDLIDTLNHSPLLPSLNCSFQYLYKNSNPPEYITKTLTGTLKYKHEGNDESEVFPLERTLINFYCKTIFINEITGEETLLSNELLEKTKTDNKAGNPYLNSLINDTNQTDDKGYFNFNFEWDKNLSLGIENETTEQLINGTIQNGFISRSIYVSIDNPYYEQPNFSLNIWQDETINNLGVITTYVKSYLLNAQIEEGYKDATTVKKALVGKKVTLFRKSLPTGLPANEGDFLSSINLQGSLAELSESGLFVVASGITTADKDENGNDIAIVQFKNLIENILQNDIYYLWIENTPFTTAEPFKFTKPTQQFSPNYIYNGSQLNNQITNPNDPSTHETLNYKEITDHRFTVNSKFTQVTNEPPMSTVTGRLSYKYNGPDGSIRPLVNTPISIIACWVTVESTPTKIAKISNIDPSFSNAFDVQVLQTIETNGSGEFNFHFPNIPPIKNTMSGQFETSTGQLNRQFASWETWESDPDPYIRIIYSDDYGPLKRVFRVVVEDPNGLFMSPDDDIEVDPLMSLDVGTLTSNVFCYQLKSSVKEEIKKVMSLSDFKSLLGVECYVLRLKSDIQNSNIPDGEGKQMTGELDEKPSYQIITKEISDNEGKFHFDNLLFRNTSIPIYQYFRTPDMAGKVNYKPIQINQKRINEFKRPVYFFNSDYTYAEVEESWILMEPKSPTVKGKVVSNVNMQQGLKGADCELKLEFTGSIPKIKTIPIPDTTGYFDFKDFIQQFTDANWLKKMTKATLTVSKPGFHYIDNGNEMSEFVRDIPIESLQKGKQHVEPKIPLTSNNSVSGFIVNENHEGVESYVQFIPSGNTKSVGEMKRTSSVFKGGFSIPVFAGNHKLAIIPRDVTYFADTIDILITNNQVNYLGNITVHERSHRIHFYVKQVINQYVIPVKNARIQLIGDDNAPIFFSNDEGKVNIKFNNVSVENLALKVSGPTGSLLIPKIISFQNEESQFSKPLPNVILEKGIVLNGKVLLDGRSTSDAEIYVDLRKGIDTNVSSDDSNSTTESQYYFKCHSKNDGSFSLLLPPETSGKEIVVKANYNKAFQINHGNSTRNQSNNNDEENNTVIGESKYVTIPGNGNLTFNLSSFNKMIIKDVWGFPINITNLNENSDGSVSISGRVKLSNYNTEFDLLEDISFEVFNVKFIKSDSIINKTAFGIPAQNKVIVQTNRSFKMNYANSFNVKLKNKPDNSFYYIEKNQNNKKGVLAGLVEIVDNSFQYPESYLTFDDEKPFWFARNRTGLIGGNTVNMLSPFITIFNSSGAGSSSNIFNLCNIPNPAQPVINDLSFEFIGFEAKAKAKNSFIDGEKITLDTKLSASIKNAGEIELNLGKLVLRNNAIDPISSDEPIIITLKDGGIYEASKVWTLEARNWEVDPKQGGLYSSNCVVHTNKLDVPIQSFNLRSDFAYIGDAIFNDITLAGFPIEFDQNAKSLFGYNTSTGSDKKGHWELVIFPDQFGNPPGKVKNLPDLSGVLELQTISLLSNGEDVFTIGTEAGGMRIKDILSFKPMTLFTTPTAFVLSGSVDFKIPRIRENIGAELVFSKNGSSNYALNFVPFDLSFNGKGNIHFNSILPIENKGTYHQYFNETDKTFVSYGKIGETGKLNDLYVKMTYYDKLQVSQIHTSIIESEHNSTQKIQIGSSNTVLENITCSMNANQSDWDLFKFEGDLAGFSGTASNSNNRMKFEVHGEIRGENSGFKMDNLSHNIGPMQITYEKNSILGSLYLDNVPLGSSFVNGTANIRFDPEGWMFYSSASISNVPAPEPTTLNSGILIGNYSKTLPEEVKNTVLTYAINKNLPETFTSRGLKGFYIIGSRNLPLSGLDVSIDLVVASGYVSIPISGVDASFYGNFVNGVTMGYDITGGFKVNFGLNAITCTSISGNTSCNVGVNGAWDSENGATLGGSINMTGNIEVEQGVPFINGCNDAVSFGIDVIGGFNLGNPFVFWYDF